MDHVGEMRKDKKPRLVGVVVLVAGSNRTRFLATQRFTKRHNSIVDIRRQRGGVIKFTFAAFIFKVTTQL